MFVRRRNYAVRMAWNLCKEIVINRGSWSVRHEKRVVSPEEKKDGEEEVAKVERRVQLRARDTVGSTPSE